MATLEKPNLVQDTGAKTLLKLWTDADAEAIQNVEGVVSARADDHGHHSVRIDPRFNRAELIAELESL